MTFMRLIILVLLLAAGCGPNQESEPNDHFTKASFLKSGGEVEGTLGFEGAQEHTVHPLLVFAELRIGGDERAREAAEEVRHRYLEHLE